ncbi:MAG: cyclopropane-fatty-acyl-phospholipid synthase family protein [Steroidobacteraceae bacterium]
MSTTALTSSSLPELATEHAAPGLLGWAERGLLPDALIRLGVRRLCAQRLREDLAGPTVQARRVEQRLDMLRAGPIAIHTDAANAQHYELPPAFFRLCLGHRLKYSCCYYRRGDETLNEAEEAMLELYAQRAQLADGQEILELGCGWGSLSLWMAEHYPNARICAVSNSGAQREYIEEQCRERGLSNLEVITRDVSRLELDPGRFDRCVSVEMFEHLRNYDLLLSRISAWLRPQGTLFVHIFAHRTLMYPFETSGPDNWLGRHFFTGGLMPSLETLLRFQRDLTLEQRWVVDGTHYKRTAEHWLQNQDRHREKALAALTAAYGNDSAPLWLQRWRMFWMACAETFGYAQGREWLVGHYRFVR